MKINPWVFGPAAAIITAFVLLGAIFSGTLETVFGTTQSFIINELGWFYIFSVAFFAIFVIGVVLSPYGKLKLGKDDEEPEFSNLTWFAMLFSAGMGIGLLFFSVAEPISHFNNPPRAEVGAEGLEGLEQARQRLEQAREHHAELEQAGQEQAAADAQDALVEARSAYRDQRDPIIEAAREAMTTTFFHWGIHAWAIYIVVGLSLAYFSFRHDLPLTIRSTLWPLLGNRVNGPLGHTVEVLAIFGTLFGVATSLGLGATQISAGLSYLGWLPDATWVQLGLIALITAIATISVVTGLHVGIRRLSEFNLVLGLVLVVLVLLAGPTVLLVSSFVQSLGHYATSLVELTFRTDAFRGADEWQQDWTMFYWAWWISWSPFVGMFIARISRGRTIREFIMGVLFVPTLLTFAWLVIFGNTAIDMEMTAGGEAGIIGAATEEALFVMLGNLTVPYIIAVLASIVAMVVIATYFVTSSDSASLVIDILSSDGDPDPPVGTRVFWAVTEGAVAAVLLVAGGLAALATGALITALPFCIIMLFICLSLARALSREGRRIERRELRTRERELAAAAAALVKTDVADQANGEVESDAEPVADWRNRLRQIARRPAGAGPPQRYDVDESRQQIVNYMRDTVLPAFEQIRQELEKSGRTVRIEQRQYQMVLHVFHEGQEEFSYAVRGRAYHKIAFAFPQLSDSHDPRIVRAEVVLPNGPDHGYTVSEFDEQQIIQDFLDEYERWKVG